MSVYLSIKDDPETRKKGLPDHVCLMSDGGCMADTHFWPWVYFPSWEMLAHYTGASVDDNEVETPERPLCSMEGVEYGPWRFGVPETRTPSLDELFPEEFEEEPA